MRRAPTPDAPTIPATANPRPRRLSRIRRTLLFLRSSAVMTPSPRGPPVPGGGVRRPLGGSKFRTPCRPGPSTDAATLWGGQDGVRGRPWPPPRTAREPLLLAPVARARLGQAGERIHAVLVARSGPACELVVQRPPGLLVTRIGVVPAASHRPAHPVRALVARAHEIGRA